MTTASDDYSRHRPWLAWVLRHTRWTRPGLMWTGHYILALLAAYAAVVLATDLAGRPDALVWTETGLWIWALLLIITSVTYHQARLCRRCAGGTPLDPEAAVEKWRPALRLDHRNLLVLAVLLANICWQVLTGNLIVSGVHALGLPRHHDVWAYLLQDIPGLIIVGGYFAVDHIHRKLYPWCPWCHWRDGGEEETVPEPDPGPSLRKTG